MRTVLELLSHGYLAYSIALMKSCWRRAVALGRVVLPRRAIAASSAREGEKARNIRGGHNFCAKSGNKLILDVFWVLDYDSDLKNSCYHFRKKTRR